jgi:hypothetical protein
MCRDAAEVAFKKLMRDPYTELYLWYFPAMNGQWGDLVVAREDEVVDGWMLVRPERVSPASTLDTLTYWIRDSVGGTPLIGDDC